MESKEADTDQIQRNSASFFIQYTADNWGFVELQADSNGQLKSMLLGEDNLTFKASSIYPAYAPQTNQAFWLGIASDNRVFELAYVPSIKTISTAQLIFGINARKKIDRINVFPKKDFPDKRFSNHVHELNQKAARACYTKMQRKQKLHELEKRYLPNILITKEKIASYLTQNTTAPTEENTDVRAPDATEHRELLGDDFLQAKTKEFQSECNDSYIQTVKGKLEKIIDDNSNDYFALKQSLKEFLNEHWQDIKGTPLSYTSLHEHPVTKLLLEIANKLAKVEGEPAISYLMPDIYTESQHEEYAQNLDSQPLETILKTHILDESGRYLIPVKLLLEIIKPPQEKQSSLMKDDKIRNPYFDASLDTNQEHEYLTTKDIERLYQHSTYTQSLNDRQQRVLTVSHDNSTLLGQLKNLLAVLKLNDANEGIGSELDAGEHVYTAAPNFMAYFRRLHPMPIHVTENIAPTPSEAFGPNSHMGYVLVRSGPDAGLHFLSKFNEGGSINDTWQRKTLCTASTTIRYPITVMLSNTFNDTEDFKETLSRDIPTLIRVPGTNIGTYHLFGKKADGSWGFTTITEAGPIILPQSSQTRTVTTITQQPANIPAEIYAKIKANNGHHVTDSMLELLVRVLPNSSNKCSLEQLKMINAQTSHLDISEFKFVPPAVRILLVELWNYLQNPGININATQSTHTCIGQLKDKLSDAIHENSAVLNDIRWSNAEKENEYQASLDELNNARDNLSLAINNRSYQGMDFRAPSPQMLRVLNLKIRIKNADDFKWFCHFPPKTISLFLNIPEYAICAFERPLNYLLHNYNDFNQLSALLLEIPTSAYSPLINKLDVIITDTIYKRVGGCLLNFNKLSILVNFLANNDKKLAFLDAIKPHLVEILKPIQLDELFKKLTESEISLLVDVMQEDFCNAFPLYQIFSEIKRFPAEKRTMLIRALQLKVEVDASGLQDHERLSIVLWGGTDDEFNQLIQPLRSDLGPFITTKEQYQIIAASLTETQSTLLLNAIEGKSILDARNTWELTVAYSRLTTEEITEYSTSIEAWFISKRPTIDECIDLFTPPNAKYLDKWKPIQKIIHKYFKTIHINIYDILPALGSDKSFNDPIKALLPALIDFPKNTGVFKSLLIKLSLKNCESLLEHLQEYLTESFLSDIEPNSKAEELYNFIAYSNYLGTESAELTEEKSLLLLKAIKPQIPLLIQHPKIFVTIKHIPESCEQFINSVIAEIHPDETITTWQINLVLLNYANSEEQSPEKFANILKNLTRLYDKPTPNYTLSQSDLNQILNKLDTTSCKNLLACLNDENILQPLRSIISIHLDLKEVLEGLQTDKIRILLETLKSSYLGALMSEAEKPMCHLSDFDDTVKILIIQATEDELAYRVKTVLNLSDLLYSCGDEEVTITVLNSLRGILSRYKEHYRSFQEQSYYPLIERRLKSRPQLSIFNRRRVEYINTGSLKSKLEKYIGSRKNEYTFHWDFLCIKWFIYWLMGKQPNVKARETKVAAATYALHAINNNEECLVRLFKAATLASANLQTNSYILVGKNTEQKRLYYVDYAGNRTRLTISNYKDIENCFSEKANGTEISYDSASSLLKGRVKDLLPTDAQLAALKEGLLGDIMQDAGVNDIISGTKTPPKHEKTVAWMQAHP